MFKKEKGITLVALVITIIVLLILAGVTISLVVGDNGILGHATNAVSTNAKATALQDVKLGAADALTQFYADWVNNKSVQRATYLTDSSYYTKNVSTSGATVSVDAAGKVTYTANGSIYKFDVNLSTGEVTVSADSAE